MGVLGPTLQRTETPGKALGLLVLHLCHHNSKPVATALGGLALLRFKFFLAYKGPGESLLLSPRESPVMITPTPLQPLLTVVKRRQGCFAQPALVTYTHITQYGRR